MSIVRADKEVMTKVSVIRCSECGAQWDDTTAGHTAATTHAATHAPLRYLCPDNRYSHTVWIDEAALVNNTGPWRAKHEINHKNKGRTSVDWIGPGWYVFREYEVHYHNDTRQYTEFRHVDVAFSELKEKMREMGQDLVVYRALQKKTRPA